MREDNSTYVEGGAKRVQLFFVGFGVEQGV